MVNMVDGLSVKYQVSGLLQCDPYNMLSDIVIQKTCGRALSYSQHEADECLPKMWPSIVMKQNYAQTSTHAKM